MKPLEDAQREVLAATAPLPETVLPAAEALGLVTTKDVVAGQDLPPFPNSAMDGYAVLGSDVGAAPVTLTVLDESAAGHPSAATVTPGTAVRIMTGAAIPAGADTIVKVEDTQPGEDSVVVLEPTAVGTSVREAGSDVVAGSRRGDLTSSAGSTTSVPTSVESTPIVSSSPMLAVPGCAENVRLTKLPIVVNAL